MAQAPDLEIDALPSSSHHPDNDPQHSLLPSSQVFLSENSANPSSDDSLRPSFLPSSVNQHFPNAQLDEIDANASHPSSELKHPSPESDTFLRRYRDSFRTREPSGGSGGVYALNQTSSTSTQEPMASVLSPRLSHFDRKPVGLPTDSVTVRLNNLPGKVGQDGSSTKREPAIIPRGRQASVKAFVSKFEQRSDDFISTPDSKPGSRSASVNNSSRSFSSRAQSSNRADERYGPSRRQSGIDKAAEQPPPLVIRKKTPNKVSQAVVPRSEAADEADDTIPLDSEKHATSQMSPVPNYPLASTNANESRPLFGEIVAGSSNFGWGIPNSSSLRSESTGTSSKKTDPIFRDDTQLDLSPTSPGTWYREPTFEGFDSSRMPPLPDQPSVHRKRSRSELWGANSSIQPSPTSPSDFSFAQRPKTPTKATQSRAPGLSRSLSYASDSQSIGTGSSFVEHMSKDSSKSAFPVDGRPVPSASTFQPQTPHRSPRHAALTLNTRNSQSLGAQITDVSPSTKSPPLRNSRQRPSLNGKIVERSQTVGSNLGQANRARKNLPEIGTVDFAARRERIQRAFSKSVEAKEAEQRRSLILEAQRRKHRTDDVPPVPPVPATGPQPSLHQHRLHEDFPEVEHPRKDSATLAPMLPDAIEEPSIDIGTILTPPPILSPPRHESAGDDSPTLGNLGQFPTRQSSSVTPSDAGSSDSNSNYFDTRAGYTDTASVRLSAPSAELSTRPQPESIHIVLGENQASSGQSRLLRGPGDFPSESRWSMSSWASSSDSNHRYSAAEARLESIEEAHDGHDQANEDSNGAPHTPLSETDPVEIPRPGSSSKTSVASSTKPWMVDQSIVPPRSFAQDTGSAAQSDRTCLSGSRQTQSPRSDKTISSPTRNRKVDWSHDEKQTDRTGRTAELMPPSFAQRASLMNPADFDAASPSIGDWIAVQALDTPIEEQSPHNFGENVENIQPKKVTGLRPRTPSKKSDGPQLPEIQSTEGGLGIDINVDTPINGGRSKAHYTTPDLPLSGMATTDVSTALDLSPPHGASSRHLSSSPSRGLISKYNSNTQGSVDPTQLADISRPISKGSRSTLDSEDPKGSSAETATMASEQSAPPKPLTEEEQKVRDAEQKRLTRRKNIIKELVDTESSFGQDMTVVVDIYKETSHVILQNPDDVKVLFGNATDIVSFSTNFLDALKGAVSSVYKLPRSKRWRSKRDSSATAESTLGDETSSISNLELTEDERDRMTSLGAVFEQHLEKMERVYTDYLKNHEQANARLAELMKSDKVQIWLKECKAYAHDLTTAWSLDSLLVKPVQRILKYPLLLKELADVTPDNHPDFVALDSMTREIIGVSKRINAAKKRADLVEQAHGSNATRKDKRKKDDRSGFAKAFGRKTEKFKQQVGLSDVAQDKAYNALADKFGSHFFQVQVVIRDIEMYTVDVQALAKKFEGFVIAMEEHMDVAQSPYPEIQSKWRVFRLSVTELQATAVTDHVTNVREHVIQPMNTLLKYYEGPQRMMEKRKKRILDHARWKQMQDAGGKVDKKLIEQGEQFVAINDTLKEELPKLFAKTKQLVEHCLNIFVQLQLQWQTIWRRKLSQAIDPRHLPRNTKDIIESFSSDFKYTEAQVLSLAICNGALKDDDSFQLTNVGTGTSSSATTLNGEDSSSRQTSITFDDVRDSRHSIQSRNRAASGSGQASSYHTATYYPAAYAQGPPRDRAGSSGTSGRRSEHHQWGSQGHLGVTSPTASAASSSGRPSSQSIRGNSVSYGQSLYDPSSYNRYSDESSRGLHWYSGWSRNSQTRPIETQYGLGAALAGAAGAAGAAANPRGSAVFSSALPPSDSTPPQQTTPFSQTTRHGSQSRLDPSVNSDRFSYETPQQFNVLFLAASVYEFNIDRARREAGYPYLTYAAGEIFDVIGEKGELWLAKNQDDPTNTLGWIWNKHFAKLASEN